MPRPMISRRWSTPLLALSMALVLAVLSPAMQAQDLRLPFEGRWFVYQGGDTPNVNHHMAVPAQWFGVDFVKVGGPSQRALSRVEPKAPEDFYSWNEPVLSPAAGEVVAVVDDLPDNPVGIRDPDRPAGNHVVVRTADGRFVFVAHLRRGSVAVRRGERVDAGRLLGRCGNSGNSDFPHVHVHVQNTLGDDAIGQNPVFAGMDVELNGRSFEDVSWPVLRGLFVAPSR